MRSLSQKADRETTWILTAQLIMAVVKCVEIIGEAANQVSSAARTELKEISWRDMIDMRHRLVHGYYDINLDVVWSTLQEDLPPLIRMLQAILGVKG